MSASFCNLNVSRQGRAYGRERFAIGRRPDKGGSIRLQRSEPVMKKPKLLLSDVDGTLVTKDKRLTPATLAAVRRLGEADIGFTIASSRPPSGFRMLVEPLGLKLPFGAFNGGTVLTPQFEVLEE